MPATGYTITPVGTDSVNVHTPTGKYIFFTKVLNVAPFRFSIDGDKLVIESSDDTNSSGGAWHPYAVTSESAISEADLDAAGYFLRETRHAGHIYYLPRRR